MPIDTSKSISTVTYNGVNIPLAGGGGGMELTGMRIANPKTHRPYSLRFANTAR